MVISFLILLCFSLKIILSKNLNEANYFHQLRNTEEDMGRLEKCMKDLINFENKTASIRAGRRQVPALWQGV